MKRSEETKSRRSFLRSSLALSSMPLVASCGRSSALLPTEQSGPAGNPGDTRQALTSLPRRVLGKTGVMISTLSFGGGSMFNSLSNGSWEQAIEKALELGVNYFDTASEYGGSEGRYGSILPSYRDEVFITTKFSSRNLATAKNEFAQSLRNLNVDYLDGYLMHDANDSVSTIEPFWEWMNELKSAGTVRFIGFSSMSSGSGAQRFIETFDPDIALLAISATAYGGYVTGPLPAAAQRNVGVLAMKAMRDVVGRTLTADEAFAYSLGQNGVASVLVGHAGGANQVEANVNIVKDIGGGTGVKYDLAKIQERAKPLAGPHALSWARPDYRDNGELPSFYA